MNVKSLEKSLLLSYMTTSEPKWL